MQCRAFTWAGNPCKMTGKYPLQMDNGEIVHLCGIHCKATRLDLERPSDEVLEVRAELNELDAWYQTFVLPVIERMNRTHSQRQSALKKRLKELSEGGS